mmetsp:Transcript_13638/g.18178  ORF Transcript_13638/g.18178 Transcript_13638/m.18178 type:complete len:451 (-) Transcript_13638:179-1531(-)|eukprot:CAMPEP_0197290444 /NCGR_PEP_ID=MMETSP0890-20130614/7657_1 /TAXON_ID=44058 ORGANISM="Aureoumbra lagunensis, Strain CCMP1510" /NCGR_SAMPLE_ID=MMETSP0890 /ASSEMBLY_ACC=CAM_ASM_000533 /LENGTH=450 /DNA_ID=CAMNT_0042762429 /DNA_START=32 /DNA_END=1384 /DNA_ORIENTATION=+
MSDDEEEYEYGSDDYNYSDEEGGNEGNDELIEIENAFYEGDDCRNDEPERAIEMFEKVVELERNREVKWRFKALEHLVVLNFRLSKFDETVERYRELLNLAPHVTRNECGDTVNAVLEALSVGKQSGEKLLSTIYELTFAALKAANNERLWFNTNIKVGKLYLQQKEYYRVASIINQLKQVCQHPDGTDDATKGTSLLEVYALEIQLCAATNNTQQMHQVYPRTLNLNAAVPDPRIMGIIREEGGKMYMTDNEWSEAYNEFYEGFRAYQEAGNARAKLCLKYVVLANMLATSNINPFDGREAKAFQDETEIAAMRQLRQAYDANDLRSFELTLKKNNAITQDPYIMRYLEPLRRKMIEQVLLSYVKPYQRLTIDFIASQLNLPLSTLQDVLIDLILDQRIAGKIDQPNNLLILYHHQSSSSSMQNDRAQAIQNWADTFDRLAQSAAGRVF